jgi:hypothetical protein
MIFISHVEEDYNIVKEIVPALESIGMKTWYYEEHSIPGPAYLSQMIRAIDKSKVVILIISNKSINSNSVTNEVVHAFEAGKPFLPILVDLSHIEFQLRQQEWRMAVGAATSIRIPESGINTILPRIIDAINELCQIPDDKLKLSIAKIRNLGGQPLQESTEETVRDVRTCETTRSGLSQAEINDNRALDVFISAKSEDFEYAQRIYEFLNENGLSAFLSIKSLPDLGNSDYMIEIDNALDNTKHMIVVTSSKEHVVSSWVAAEWRLFIKEKRSGNKLGNLITLTIGSLRAGDLPASLRYYEVIPFEEDNFSRIIQYLK